MSYKTLISLLLAILVYLLLSQGIYQVPQGSMGVMRRYQAVTVAGQPPGAYLKLPFLEKTSLLDAGGITLVSDSVSGGRLEFVSADGQSLETGYMAVWRIADVKLFCHTLDCDEAAAARQLHAMILPELRAAFAYQSRAALLAHEAHLGDGWAEQLNHAAAGYGMQIIGIHLTGIGLAPAALDEVYTRMRSVETARATSIKAEGAADSARLRAAADAERQRILSAADAEALRLRAGGDAHAAAIYAAAARQQPDFFSFFRSLQVYRRSLAGRTVLVLDADSPFLKYLKTPPAH
jgi:membrane protease subunit HflC